MFKYILENAGDINWMAIFALLTFFILFVIVLITTFWSKQSVIDRLASLPLDDNNTLTLETSERHEK
ncbi:MAG: cbb3-type cytochrome c oxidase subunit 3 [Saprospiraceae bacterium]|nr:cbb3-type cytochrome c oxidase subunit 3 [Saprospiraceae bacterium]